MTGARSLGAQLAAGLKSRGVDTVFGIPGVHNVELYRGIEDAGITHILARHEQGAGFMADGFARASNKPGIVFVISGPGLTNVMTPMGQAYSDSIPMLVISSVLPTGDMPGRLHEMRDQVAAAGAVCDWSEPAVDPKRAFELLDRAFDEFESVRSRPKHIAIPVDTLGQIAECPARVVGHSGLPKADADEVHAIAGQHARARRPLFVFGAGAARASVAANELLTRTEGAAFTTFAGRGIIDPLHPGLLGSTIGQPDSCALSAMADLVVVIGSELSESDLQRNRLGHDCEMIRVDIDPAALADCHAAEIPVLGEAADFMRRLSDILPAKITSDWDFGVIAHTRHHLRAAVEAQYPGLPRLCQAMQAAIPPDTMICSDMTQFAYAANFIAEMSVPGHWHHPTGFGTLGYALPAAIGAKIARGAAPTIAIAGDYGFQYTLQELGVAAELGLVLPVILWDNGKLKEIEDCMVQSQIAPHAVVAQNPDFALLAAAYGIAYERPSSLTDFQNALRRGFAAAGPTLIHLQPGLPES